jgi:hypothetical protein
MGVPNLRARLERALHREVDNNESQGVVLVELLEALERAQHEIKLLRDQHAGQSGSD